MVPTPSSFLPFEGTAACSTLLHVGHLKRVRRKKGANFCCIIQGSLIHFVRLSSVALPMEEKFFFPYYSFD